MIDSTKPIILFDVDKTLIDTNLLIRGKVCIELQKILSLSADEYQQRELEYSKSLEKYTDFEPLAYLKVISQQSDVTELASKTILNRSFHEQAVFDDAIPTLAALSESYTLGVFSEANLEWQQNKLELAGLLHFFEPEPLYILRRKTAPEQLQKLPKPVIIVDDNPEVIASLQLVSTITPIWINRLNKPVIPNTTTVQSLSELKNVLATKGTHV